MECRVSDDPWVVRSGARGTVTQRLFCFPYAGGGTITFADWQRLVPPGVEVCAIRPPGRETRIRERPLRCLDTLVASIVTAIVPLLDQPFAFFGHSMGGLLAFETVRHLRRLGLPPPTRLFVSASRAPSVPPSGRRLFELDTATLIAQLGVFDGTPHRILQDERLMELFLPTIRADLEAIETHCHRVEPPLELPIDAFGGANDTLVPPALLDPWAAETSAGFSLRLLPGGHFFIDPARAPLLRALGERLGNAEESRGDGPHAEAS